MEQAMLLLAKKEESGAIMVEAALTIGALFLIGLGTFGFTLYLRENETMSEAIAAGALAAAATPANTSGAVTAARIESTVAEFLRRTNRNPADFVISVAPIILSVPGLGYPDTTAQAARIKIRLVQLPIAVPGLSANHSCLYTTATLSEGTTVTARSDGGADTCND